jgi:hypothetical protein
LDFHAGSRIEKWMEVSRVTVDVFDKEKREMRPDALEMLGKR